LFVELTKKIDASWNTRNSADFGSLFIENSSFKHYDGKITYGRKNIENYYSNLFVSMPADLNHTTFISSLKNINSKVSVVQGIVNISSKIKEKETVIRSVHYTAVCKKYKNEYLITDIILMIPYKQ